MELSEFQNDYLWTLIAGFVLSFIVGFGLGANDIANSFGPAIGSGVIGYVKAYILASIFEILGATLVGHDVTLTLRKYVIQEHMYKDVPAQLLLGQIAICCAMAFWLVFATLLDLPVAASHAMIGSSIGFSIVCQGFSSLEWDQILYIAIGWLLAPIASGIVSAILYLIIDFTVLRRKQPLKCGLRLQPLLYFFTIAFMVFAVIYDGSSMLYLSKTPIWLALVMSALVGLISALVYKFLFEKRLVNWIKRKKSTTNISCIKISDINAFRDTAEEKNNKSKEKQPKFKPTLKGLWNWFFPAKGRKEDQEAESMFSALQVLIACFASFAHGSNEVSNVISMPATILYLYQTMNVEVEDSTAWWIFLFGGISISIGIWCLGHKVIATIGKKMSNITQSSGFAIVLGMAMTTVVASKIGAPVSTTQGIVGSVVGVGLVKSGKGIKWKILLETIGAWFITLPVTGLISAGIMFVLKIIFL